MQKNKAEIFVVPEIFGTKTHSVKPHTKLITPTKWSIGRPRNGIIRSGNRGIKILHRKGKIEHRNPRAEVAKGGI